MRPLSIGITLFFFTVLSWHPLHHGGSFLHTNNQENLRDALSSDDDFTRMATGVLHETGPATTSLKIAPTAAISGTYSATDEKSQVPKYLYHITTMHAWRNIQQDGELKPYSDGTISGIFTVELDNFYRNWVSEEHMRPKTEDGPSYYRQNETPFIGLLEYEYGRMIYRDERREFIDMSQKPKNIDSFDYQMRLTDNGLIVLAIAIDPLHDRLGVRDNRYNLVTKFFSLKKYLGSLKPISQLTQQEHQAGILEYIIYNSVSLDRVAIISSVQANQFPSWRNHGVREWHGRNVYPSGARLFEQFFPRSAIAALEAKK